MMLAIVNGAPWTGPWMPVPPNPARNRRQRILQALGASRGSELWVNEETLARYYDYLEANLQLPFTVCYPKPLTPAHTAIDRCSVVRLIDPREGICDPFDGIYCQTRKGRFFTNLPLVELTLVAPGPNAELLGDYEYWFWNWQR